MKDRLQKLIKEALTKPAKKGCNCGCDECNKAPILNENLQSRIIMTENMKYHIDGKKPLIENTFRYGSKAFLDLWAEARYLYSRDAIDLSGIDKEIILETHLGEYGLYEGKMVPLDMPMVEETTSLPLLNESILKNLVNKTIKETVVGADKDFVIGIMQKLKSQGKLDSDAERTIISYMNHPSGNREGVLHILKALESKDLNENDIDLSGTVTTKKKYAGYYDVFVDGKHAGYVMQSEDGKFWSAYDLDDQPFESGTKSFVLNAFGIKKKTAKKYFSIFSKVTGDIAIGKVFNSEKQAKDYLSNSNFPKAFIDTLEIRANKSLNEAQMLDGYEVDFFHTKANVYANIEIPSENPTFEDDIQIKGTGKTEEEAFIDLKQNYNNYKKTGLNEAEYKGKDVQLNKPKRGGSKKFYVYVMDPKTKRVKKVSFGAAGGGQNLAVKIRDPKARKAFAARQNCDQKKDKTKPGYWSCNIGRYWKSLGGGSNFSGYW